MKLRALVVDDTALFRRVVSDALASLPDVEVVAAAPNGKIALERIESLKPDLVTMDVEMPEMDGIQVLEEIKQNGWDCGVVMVSAHTLKGGELTIRALEKGAFDFITKPSGGDVQANLNSIREALLPVVNAYRRKREIRSILTHSASAAVAGPAQGTIQASGLAHARPKPALANEVPVPAARGTEPGKADLVVLGISTGGPNALTRMLPALPAQLPAPVLIVQHMPPLFTQSLAASLNSKCSLHVKEAEDGDIAKPATIYIAPGGKQMKAVSGQKGEIVLRITDDPPENNCKPSADYLFRSVANNFPGRAAAVIMTGMGSDGVLGLRLLKRHGCRVIAQDEASCIVFGMPGEAVKAGVVDIITPLEKIADEIRRAVKS